MGIGLEAVPVAAERRASPRPRGAARRYGDGRGADDDRRAGDGARRARPGGDRYFDARGTFSDPHANGHDLTLIEAEVLDALALPTDLAPEQARRNVVTRGIDLNALVGRHFTVGAVRCIGRRLCEPCAHLQGLTVPGTLRALVHQGGLRADVLTDGVICVGDACWRRGSRPALRPPAAAPPSPSRGRDRSVMQELPKAPVRYELCL